mmetsp:Transcript_60307/g.140462  ORF Transcript_60307/g.140462 Transcript_60307/m.140462 type:complete len:779 (+) Transcript_60307:84-2420(+)
MGSVRVWSVLHLLPLLLKFAAAAQAEDELVAIFSGDDGPELHEALAQDVNSSGQQKEPVNPTKQNEEPQLKPKRKVQAFIAKNSTSTEQALGGELVASKEAIGACGSVNENTPIGKICELLEELRLQLQEDAAADGEQFKKFSTWFAEQNSTLRTTIKNTVETVETLQAQLEQQEALRKDTSLAVEKVANKLQDQEKELSEAVAQRSQAHKAFEENEAKLLQMIEQLKRSLEVLGKQAPGDEASARSSAAGLIEAAKKLKATLLQGPDFSLGLSQRETIEGFLHVVQRRARSLGGGLRGAEAPVPDFLQVGDATSGPYGEYENQNSGVATALESVLNKAVVNLQDQRMQEEHEEFVFNEFESELKKQIRNTERSLTTKKGEISESQEHSGSLQADLLNAQELLKVSKEGLLKLEAEFAAKNSSYQERSRKRADELIAVEAAGKIITSDDMKTAVPDHWSRVGTPTSLLQLREVSRQKAIRVVREAETPALAFLALRTQTSLLRSNSQADPFHKVTQLIREMIERLEQAAARDATKASWCQSEWEKSSKSEDGIQASVEKLEARISEIDTEVAQLDADMKRIKEELAEMAEASGQATELREEEKQEAMSAVIRYKDAQRLLRSALAVLQKIYGKEASPSSGGTDPDSGYKVSGMGAGVVGLLEIAVEDFAQMEEETQTAEVTAQRDYKELMDEAEVRTAAFKKDLDYKINEKVKLESDRVQAVADLKNYQKEKEALVAYIKQLKVQCNAADPYEVRKARRESELRSLQDALNFLEGTVP